MGSARRTRLPGDSGRIIVDFESKRRDLYCTEQYHESRDGVQDKITAWQRLARHAEACGRRRLPDAFFPPTAHLLRIARTSADSPQLLLSYTSLVSTSSETETTMTTSAIRRKPIHTYKSPSFDTPYDPPAFGECNTSCMLYLSSQCSQPSRDQ